MNNLSYYDYDLPQKNLALKPVSPSDNSKLFVYDTKTGEIVFDRFFNLDKYLPRESFLVLNNTKVLPTKVEMKKKNGGKVMVLFLINEIIKNNSYQLKDKEKRMIKIMVDRKIKVGEKLYFQNNEFIEVIKQEKNLFWVGWHFSLRKLLFLLEKYGKMPVPLYLRKTPLSEEELKERYQSVFAQEKGSVAAPTASLHFTQRVFKKLKNKGINRYFITLHIGLGTFAPVKEANLKKKRLHDEYYEIKDNAWQSIKQEKEKGKKLVAVGTTVVRALESFKKRKFSKTDLFILPPFNFQMVDILLTNFHLPRSSLMMLVEAFLQDKKAKNHLVKLYQIAIKNDFRFYSFGDAMLII